MNTVAGFLISLLTLVHCCCSYALTINFSRLESDGDPAPGRSPGPPKLSHENQNINENLKLDFDTDNMDKVKDLCRFDESVEYASNDLIDLKLINELFKSDEVVPGLKYKGDEEVETSNTYREAPSSKLDYIGTKNEANEITIECEGETGGTKLTKTPKASPLWVQSNTNDIVLECGNNWTKILKTPKSSQLCGKPKPMLSRARRKADITNECKTRISALSEVRMELCQLQMQSLKEENERKQQEHKLNMKQKKEIHLLDVQHKQLQLDLLKKQIPSP